MFGVENSFSFVVMVRLLDTVFVLHLITLSKDHGNGFFVLELDRYISAKFHSFVLSHLFFLSPRVYPCFLLTLGVILVNNKANMNLN